MRVLLLVHNLCHQHREQSAHPLQDQMQLVHLPCHHSMGRVRTSWTIRDAPRSTRSWGTRPKRVLNGTTSNLLVRSAGSLTCNKHKRFICVDAALHMCIKSCAQHEVCTDVNASLHLFLPNEAHRPSSCHLKPVFHPCLPLHVCPA